MPKRFESIGHRLVAGLLLGLLSACTTTVDSLGYNHVSPLPTVLPRIECPSEPTNYYLELPGVTETDVSDKLQQAINTLFHGNADTQAIYFTSEAFYSTDVTQKVCAFSSADEGTACIRDFLHGDVRTEGLGLGMLAAVMLNHREEFDLLWRYAQLHHQRETGAAAGYFTSWCDTTLTEKRACLDPYGLEQFVMALLVAHQRWGSADATHPDYQADVLGLLSLLRMKVLDNGGIVDDVTNSFDSNERLMYDEPNNGGKHFQRTALTNPGYFDIWAMVTGDAFYTEAAVAGREFLTAAAEPTRGFFPIAANFDGTPRKGASTFAAESFRVDLNLVIDELWGTSQGLQKNYQLSPINRMLQFFSSEGLDTYGSEYSLDGTQIVTTHTVELVLANAVIASISTVPDRKAYLQAAWDLAPPEGPPRYYSGILYLVTNLILSGQFRLCW